MHFAVERAITSMRNSLAADLFEAPHLDSER